MTSGISLASIPNSVATTRNNFDLIRFFAATQVALSHALAHLNVKSYWTQVLDCFPGVPIFFFISGFLIYQSWDNIKIDRLKVFVINRFLRLYPALFFCFVFTCITLIVSGYLDGKALKLAEVLGWAISQLTFFQFYNPDFLRGYGVGAVNGSLWTISVELQFYTLTPVIWFLYTKHRRAAIAVFVLFVILNLLNTAFNHRDSFSGKLISVTFIPWIFMFLFGAYVSANRALQLYFVKSSTLLLLTAYLVIYYTSGLFNVGSGNQINFLAYAALSALIVKIAFTYPGLSNLILRRNDISYGVYIFHMPVINYILVKGIAESHLGVILAMFLTYLAAIISWVLVERPALHLKTIAFRRY